MKRLLSILLIPLFVFAFSGLAFGWGSTGGDGERFDQLQETAVFFNNSGEQLYHGWAVILDTAGSGVSSGTTLGGYVTFVDGGSSVLVVGIVQRGSTGWFNQRPVVVVTKGPVIGVIVDSSDAVTGSASVGTSTHGTGRYIGGGDNLGIALEAGDGTDYDEIIIWVAPSGAAD